MSGIASCLIWKGLGSKNKSPSLWLALLRWKECCSDTKIPATGFFLICHFIFKSSIHWGNFLTLFLPAFLLFLTVCSFHLYKINLQTVNYLCNCSFTVWETVTGVQNNIFVHILVHIFFYANNDEIITWMIQERLNINSVLVH